MAERTGRGETASAVRFVPIESLRTTLAPLRRGRSSARRRSQLGELPIRVVVAGDGFEVVDGFKRLEKWCAEGRSLVPVIVDKDAAGPELKRRLLEANAPPRTVGPSDEAAVVRSLIEDDKLTPAAAGRVLEKRPRWIAQRLALATKLSARTSARLAHGTIGPMAALALAPLPADEQDALGVAADRHELGAREVVRLVAAWRATRDEGERRALLADARGRIAPLPASRGVLGPRARALAARLDEIEDALHDLARFALPDDLTDAERRRLEAQLVRVHHQLHETARALGVEGGAASLTTREEVPPGGHERRADERRREEPTRAEAARDRTRGARRDPSAQAPLRDTRDREARGSLAEAREEGPRERTDPRERDDARGAAEQELARSLPRADQGAPRGGPDGEPDPARDPGRGARERVPGRQDDPRRLRERPPGRGRAGLEEEGETPLRDPPGPGGPDRLVTP